MAKRKTPEDYYALAKERGFRWIGPEVPNIHTKTGWECEKGHRWEAQYSNIRSGTGCPACSVIARKTPGDYRALAEKRGFSWLGPEVPNARTKTGWECKQGHQWEARYNSIQQGQGCPVCAKKIKTSEDYHALVEKRGFRWLGPEVSNTNIRTGWECGQGHEWEAAYNNVRRGRGCPFCAGVAPKTPDDYRTLAEERGFRWLGPEVSNTNIKTGWECQQGHRWNTCYSIIRQGCGCPVCAGKLPKTPDDYHALAKERGFRWLGPKVPNTGTKTEWECEKGHRWETPYGNIQQGSGCPVCAGVAPKTPDDYHALAEERGFRWVGLEVHNIGTKTGWECKQGHRWEARYNNIRHGSGCPVCAGRTPKASLDEER